MEPFRAAATGTLRIALLLRPSYDALAWASSAGSLFRHTRSPACAQTASQQCIPACRQPPYLKFRSRGLIALLKISGLAVLQFRAICSCAWACMPGS